MNSGSKLLIVVLLGMMTFVFAGVRRQAVTPSAANTKHNDVQSDYNKKTSKSLKNHKQSEETNASEATTNEQTAEQEKKDFESLITDLDKIQERSHQN